MMQNILRVRYVLPACLLITLLAGRQAGISAGDPPVRPDPKLTPGATLAVTKEDICVPGYSKKVRNVPQSVKHAVYLEYGITSHKPREFEIDHLVSIELGGSNSISNLWPERYDIVQDGKQVGARTKDRVENRLHALICAGKLDIKTAQREIAGDWIAAYKKFIGPLPDAKLSSTPLGPKHNVGVLPALARTPVERPQRDLTAAVGSPLADRLGFAIDRQEEFLYFQLLCPGRRRDRGFSIHSLANTLIQSRAPDFTSWVTRPFLHTLGFAERGDAHVIGAVLHLLPHRRPTTVIRRVSEGVVDSVNRQVLGVTVPKRPFPESAVVGAPFVADRDSSASVTRIGCMGGLVTAKVHGPPYLIQTSSDAVLYGKLPLGRVVHEQGFMLLDRVGQRNEAVLGRDFWYTHGVGVSFQTLAAPPDVTSIAGATCAWIIA